MRGLTGHSKPGAFISVAAVALATALVVAAWLRSDSLTVVAIALPAGVALIYHTVSMRVRQHAEPLALYRAVGASRWSLERDVLIRSSWVGALGSFAGTGIGLLVAAPGGILRQSLAAIPAAIVMGMAVTIATATIASWRLMTRPSAHVLRHEQRETRCSKLVCAIGIATIIAGIIGIVTHPGGHLSTMDKTVSLAGVFLVWLGVILAAPLLALSVLKPFAWIAGVYGGPTFRHAVREALRHPRRTATTASSLITGICLVCAFAASGTMLGLVMLVAVFDVTRTMLQSGVDRRHDISVLRSVGASKAFIHRMVTRENILIAICATVLGLLAGLALGGVIQHITRAQSISDLSMPVGALAIMLGILAVIGVAALWWPTDRAAREEILPHHTEL